RRCADHRRLRSRQPVAGDRRCCGGRLHRRPDDEPPLIFASPGPDVTDDDRDAPPPRPPLRSALARLSDSALALLRTRGELAAVEYAEERERLKRSAVTLAVALLMLAFALGGVGLWVVVYFWDTGRL